MISSFFSFISCFELCQVPVIVSLPAHPDIFGKSKSQHTNRGIDMHTTQNTQYSHGCQTFNGRELYSIDELTARSSTYSHDNNFLHRILKLVQDCKRLDTEPRQHVHNKLQQFKRAKIQYIL
jgi:hypothetical protein